jgi:hypothetical protein
MSLSLSGVAGCATPVPGTSSLPVETAQATAPAQMTEQPAAPGQQPVPAGVAAAQTLSLQGVVTFRGAALAGYAVKAFNPLTGAELPLASPIVTDGQGRFQAAVTGLQAGNWVRVVATKGNVALETTTKADAQTPELALTEVATVLSLVADGPLKVAGLLNAEQLGTTADTYMAAVADLKAPVAAQLAQASSSANAIITRPETDKQRLAFESALETVVSNTGRSPALVEATLALVKSVSAQPHAKQFSAYAIQAESLISTVRFLGTHLKAGIGGGEGSGLRITNVRTGQSVDAKTGNVDLVKKPKKNKKRQAQFRARYAGTHPLFGMRIALMFGGDTPRLPSILTPPASLAPGVWAVDYALVGTGMFGPEGNGVEVDGEAGTVTIDETATNAAQSFFRLKVDGEGEPTAISFPLFTQETNFPLGDFGSQYLDLEALSDVVAESPAPGVTGKHYRFQFALATDMQVPFRLSLYTNDEAEVVGYRMYPESMPQVPTEGPELGMGFVPNELMFIMMVFMTSEGVRFDHDNETWTPMDFESIFGGLQVIY